MYGSSDYHNRQQHGWDTAASDYHTHVSRIARTPTVLTDVPHYPNVHKIFNRSKVMAYEEEKGNHRNQQQQQQLQPQRSETPATEPRKKVHFVEEKVVEVAKDRDEGQVLKKSVDEEVEGFIQQRRKNFELCKWATFKP